MANWLKGRLRAMRVKRLLIEKKDLEDQCHSWDCVLKLARQKNLPEDGPYLVIENHIKWLGRKIDYILKKLATETTQGGRKCSEE